MRSRCCRTSKELPGNVEGVELLKVTQVLPENVEGRSMELLQETQKRPQEPRVDLPL